MALLRSSRRVARGRPVIGRSRAVVVQRRLVVALGVVVGGHLERRLLVTQPERVLQSHRSLLVVRRGRPVRHGLPRVYPRTVP
jgi:hypothetical protein